MTSVVFETIYIPLYIKRWFLSLRKWIIVSPNSLSPGSSHPCHRYFLHRRLILVLLYPTDTPKKSRHRKRKSSKTAASSSPKVEIPVALPVKDPNSSLYIFTYDQLRVATWDFRPDARLGEGGFGIVYKGVMRFSTEDQPVEVAVKVLNPYGLQGHNEWLVRMIRTHKLIFVVLSRHEGSF